MAQLPVTNATLTKVAAGGYADDYDQTATANTAKWEGLLGVYVVQKRVRVFAGTGPEDRNETYIVIPHGALDVELGDALTFAWNGVEQSREVRDVQPHPVAGTTRLYFEDQ